MAFTTTPVPRVRAGGPAPSLRAWRPSPELLLGAWLNAFLVAMIVGRSGQPALLFAALLAGAALVFWLVRSRAARFSLSPATTWGALLLVFSVAAGFTTNLHRYEAYFVVGNMVSMMLAFGTAYLLATRMELDFRRLLACYCACALLLLPIPVLNAEMVWGRLVGDLHPNFVGMIAMTAFIGGLCMAGWRRWLVLVATVAVMIVVSSRASILASAIAALSFALFRPASADSAAVRARRTLRWASGGLGLLLGLLVLQLSGLGWFEAMAESVFKLNDPYRGMHTGATGRSVAWTAALELWQTQPLFGAGFKALPGGLAHSAYLGMLAETGLVGLVAYLLLCGAAMASLLRRRGAPDRHIRLALVISYLAYGLVEARAINFGNPYSILFLWIAFDATRLRMDASRAASFTHGSSRPNPAA